MANDYIPRNYIPTKYFLTKGVGLNKNEKFSMELALRDARIEDYNYRSLHEEGIIPEGCMRIDKDEGFKLLKRGQFIDCILQKHSTNEPNRLICVGIGIATPDYRNGSEKNGPYKCGYILGETKEGMTDERMGEYIERAAAINLATKLKVDFNPDLPWSELEKILKNSGKVFKTSNFTQSAEGEKDGNVWKSIVVAAIYLP